MNKIIAAKAMQRLLATIDTYPDEHWRDGLAMDAYRMADAMLKARDACFGKESSNGHWC